VTPCRVEIVVPVHNESACLARNILRLTGFLAERCGHPWRVVIAENGSTDGTPEIAAELARSHPQVTVLQLDRPGRGRAVKLAWSRSPAGILSYMDVDLSSDLTAFPALIEPLASGRYEIAVGSRLLRPSTTRRSRHREFISRSYNLLVRKVFHTRFSDAQCGFKALTATAARTLLPLLEDNDWFMDTELLVLAERLGFPIFDLPVAWEEDPDSRVKLWRTAWDDLRGMRRLRAKVKGLGRF